MERPVKITACPIEDCISNCDGVCTREDRVFRQEGKLLDCLSKRLRPVVKEEGFCKGCMIKICPLRGKTDYCRNKKER